jgi:serine/threonine protein kinase
MVGLPQLTAEQIAETFPNLRDVDLVGTGGQKVVFRVNIGGHPYALKFVLLPEEIDSEEGQFPDVAARAKREVEIMRDCISPYIVKLGPIGLEFCDIAGQKLLYFSEEFIDGHNLKDILTAGARLQPADVVTLGTQITSAIQELWSLGKIHRDIKPGNIMKRLGGDYVLLDAGLAFDVVGESLSAGFLVGTPPYFSPEQFLLQ